MKKEKTKNITEKYDLKLYFEDLKDCKKFFKEISEHENVTITLFCGEKTYKKDFKLGKQSYNKEKNNGTA
jgi:hypothetical protein